MIEYLDDFLILGKTFEETILSRNAVIYLLQNLGFFCKLKESSSPNTENRILGDDNRLGRDDSVRASGEGRVDFQKVPRYIVNVGGINKRPSKGFGKTIVNSNNNSSCTIVHKVPAETKN